MRCLWAIAGLACVSGTGPAAVLAGTVRNASTGAPLKRAVVELSGAADVAFETDASGRFSFSGLAGGTYELKASRQGFLTGSYGGRRYSSRPILLGAAEERQDIEIRLWPMSVISGRVTNEDGEPMMGLPVFALRLEYRDGKKNWAPAGQGTTSDRGEYRIAMLAPGRYLVRTDSRLPTPLSDELRVPPVVLSEERYPETYYPGVTQPGDASIALVAAGAETASIDIRVTPSAAFRIRGRVALPKGADAATVGLRPAKQTKARFYAQVYSSEEPFAIAGLEPGSYVVVAEVDGTALAGETPVEVVDRNLDGIVVPLTAGGEIRGTVKVVDSTAPPDWRGLRILHHSLNSVYYDLSSDPVAADGTFSLKNVRPGHFAVKVDGVPECCFVRSIVYGGDEIAESGATRVEGTPLEIVLSAAAAQVSGVVTDADGKPVAGATVALAGADGIRGAAADASGQYRFASLPPGDYQLFAWEDIEPESYFDPEVRKAFVDRAQSITLGPGDRLTAPLQASPAASGQ